MYKNYIYTIDVYFESKYYNEYLWIYHPFTAIFQSLPNYLLKRQYNHAENNTVHIFFLPATHMGLHLNYKKS